jgi:hypothetical protein
MDWKALFQEAENIWLYIRETDNNFAFHVHSGLLSLACCKPGIRNKAQTGDIVVAMTSVAGKKPLCISGIFRVSEPPIRRQRYYDLYANGYAGLDARDFKTGRLDNIYNNDRLLINEYHHPADFRYGYIRQDMESDKVILSTEFSCFGQGTPKCPGIPVPENLKTIPRGSNARPYRYLKKGHEFNPDKWPDADAFRLFLIQIAGTGVTEVNTKTHRCRYDWSRWDRDKAATIVKEARAGKEQTSTL